jgi:hypothetical protein
MGRAMQTISAPLFDYAIPKVKFAAWADEMETWLRSHPEATQEEQLGMSRQLINSMDDRFGEMVQDNLFLNRALRQAANLSLVSVGWEYGSLRAFGGAAKDIAQGKLLSPRARWLYSFPAIMALSAGVYQYLKAGKTPGEDTGAPGQDLAFPRTGGKTPEGAYERALLPGYEKDAMRFWDEVAKPAGDADLIGAGRGAVGIASGKLAPAWQTAKELVTGKDYFGNEIRDYFKAVVSAFTPIPLSQETLKGSNIGQAERFSGVRSAPARHEDPLRFETQQYKQERNELVKEFRGLYAHGQRTTESAETLRKKGEEIRKAMRDLDAKFQATRKTLSEQRERFFPPKPSLEFPAMPTARP